MKLIANNGEVLAEWNTFSGKRNLYCHGGFGLMLTKKAMERCIRADDQQSYDLFDKEVDKVEKKETAPADVPENESTFKLFGMEF